MTRIKSLSIAAARLAAAFALSLPSAPASAADLFLQPEPAAAPSAWTFRGFDGPWSYSGEFGLRLWVGSTKTGKTLFDVAGASPVSRLTYNDLGVFTGEAYSRFDFNNGWFVKGYAGGGALFSGKLKDEDFPPAIDPYSATRSTQDNGSLFYGSIDGGFNVLRGADFRIGVFGGYQFLRQTVSAYGCGQLATNVDVCGGGVPDLFKVITQVNNWHSVRVGLDASAEIDRFKVSVDAAYVPYVRLSGADSHWLRMDTSGTVIGAFNGPIPEDGNGWGVQTDAFVSYRVNDLFSIGVGGRYWHMETKGNTHFEGHVVGVPALPQPVNWKTDNFGLFLQSSVKLGPAPMISGN